MSIRTPDCFVLIALEIESFIHEMEQLDFDFLIRVCERAVLVVLAGLFVDETLAILGFIACRVIQLLDFVVGE